MPTFTGFFDVTIVETLVVADVPFTPKAAIFMAVGQTADGLNMDDAVRFGIGIASYDGAAASVSFFAEDEAFYPFNNASSVYSGLALQVGDDLEITINSWNTFGWTFDINGIATPNVPDWRVYYIAWGGQDCVAAGGNLDVHADGSDTVYTGLGFEPQLMFGVRGETSVVGSDIGFGAATKQTFIDQFANALTVNDNARGANALTQAGEFLSRVGSWRTEITATGTDGFTLRPIVPPGVDTQVSFIAIRDDAPASGFAVVNDDWQDGSVAYNVGFEAGNVVFSTWMEVDSSFPSIVITMGWQGRDGFDNPEGTDAALMAAVLYNAGVAGDPWDPPRYGYRLTAGGSAQQLWYPDSMFSPPTVVPAGVFGEAAYSARDTDGYVVLYDANPFDVGPGDLPSATWPASPVQPIGMVASYASPFFLGQQIYRLVRR